MDGLCPAIKTIYFKLASLLNQNDSAQTTPLNAAGIAMLGGFILLKQSCLLKY